MLLVQKKKKPLKFNFGYGWINSCNFDASGVAGD
jgi:hypothetical protein